MRTLSVCTASTGMAAPIWVCMRTSSGIWHTGISSFGILYGIVPTISTGTSTHLISTTPGSMVTPPGIMTPGIMIPGIMTHTTGTVVITILITTTMARVWVVTEEWPQEWRTSHLQDLRVAVGTADFPEGQ